MLAYGCIAVLFLFVASQAVLYWVRQKATPSPADIDARLVSIVNGESGRTP
ncbi:hypothetical protein M5W83_19160 [Paenibacillus thiaminolyticus]|uniref:Uncharacterized protein n=1 Tax=Paenibacillus thiaminolyticus TaxID=49283 RepID=A0ABT4FZF3_PANTH|nr:hypothetical protein [Paenibacillus thiaminolyticus]MCY9536396.1 hypothetical protein [Paenibacillus thiaminolyticus]MCY9601408.1 hypothetical protein [Paenibacillus thiaminolyticus]MCY9609270.1 hypothetical protein [Paenibacillus thiaminolyticus]MCY9613063.1 hypothetical protein [Paenibacillus thiaminolyticus]MCY9616953.1 hypothetical protein [Paenibacillus thiaminolyticus]